MGYEYYVYAAVVALAAYGNKEARVGRHEARDNRIQQFEKEKRRAEIANLREVRQQLRASRLAQAQIANQAAVSGTSGSSRDQGALSSVASQTAGSISYVNQQSSINEGILNNQIGAVSGETRMAEGAAWGNLAGTIFAGSGGWGEVFKKVKSLDK